MMWQSKNDVVKDLAFLNDFGVPGDEEPYKFLYSLGRGSRIKEKSKISKKFLDSRTGELISIDDEVGIQESKGRGSLLGSYLRKKTQLQEQLRLARPLGSCDAAIESYCRRNVSSNNPKNSSKTSDSEPETAIQTTADLRFDKTRQRIKAVRNSSSQSNALISNLLSKINAKSDGNEMSSNYDNCWCSNTDFNIKELENGFEENKRGGKNDSSTSDSCNETEKQIHTVGHDGFDSDGKNINKMEAGCCSLKDITQRQERVEKYKRLGEIINGSSEIISNNYVRKMQHFIQCSKCITPIETGTDLEPVFLNTSDADVFVYNKDEFPPLGKD